MALYYEYFSLAFTHMRNVRNERYAYVIDSDETPLNFFFVQILTINIAQEMVSVYPSHNSQCENI